jgi:hypothetical protein
VEAPAAPEVAVAVAPRVEHAPPPVPRRASAVGRKLRPGELRRAIVLSEIIRRPNFEKLPVERELF